jgi:hypothetical protein
LLSACSSRNIESYSVNLPKLDVKEFFSGELLASGIVKNSSGEVIRYFTAKLTGEWQGNRGTLKEVFYFNDDKIEYRTWQLEIKPNNEFTGTANDVIGVATGQQNGNAIFMTYTLQIPFSDDTLNLNVDDRMFLVSPDTLISESYLSKFGFDVGEVVLTIRKI